MLKPDLLHNLSAQLGAFLDTTDVLVDSVGPLDLGVGRHFHVESRKGHGWVRDVEIGIVQEASLEVVGGPCDDAGPAEFVAEMLDESQHHLSARLSNSKADLQFFNPVFQVRPFPLDGDVTSPVHHGLTGKGRPAAPAEQGAAA